MVSFCGRAMFGYVVGASELHVEAVDPSVEAVHVCNMVGYYIIVYVLACPISRSWKLHGLGAQGWVGHWVLSWSNR